MAARRSRARCAGTPVTPCQTCRVPQPADSPICSARGCRTPAAWALRWNNPRLHDAERRKTWLACDAHRTSLSEFLAVRGFLRAVEPFVSR